MRSVRLFALLALTCGPVWAHQHIDPANARAQDDVENQTGKGIKVDRAGTTGTPCGSAAGAVPNANKLTAGQNFTFKVYATIAHPGHEFAAIYQSNNPTQDSQFIPLTLVSATYTDQNGAVTNKTIDANAKWISKNLNRVQPGFKDLAKGCTVAGKCFITATVKVPTNVVCNPTCTIQWVESMEENAAAPTFYKSCMDVSIAGATGATPTPDPSPTPTPTPSPGVPTPTPSPEPPCH